MKTFVQVNIGEEPQKNGVSPKNVNQFVNIKYKWGGKHFSGVACSGLIQLFLNFNNTESLFFLKVQDFLKSNH